MMLILASQIHNPLFQRYGKRENQVTNNTLLMLRHLYNESPKKLNSVLSTLTDMGEDFFVGVSFNQQVKGTSSVPAAQIFQSPVSIYLGQKLTENWMKIN